MATLSLNTADAIRGVGVLAGKLNGLSGGVLGDLLKFSTSNSLFSLLSQLGAETRTRPRANRNVTGRNNTTLFDADAAKAKKLEADRLKVVKAQEALLKKQTAELKRQALTKKQSALFDLDQIQLVAALQGKLSKEEQDRVKLQLALLTGNTTEADKLSQKIAMTIDSTGKLAAYLKTLPDAKNPFLGWDEWLKNFTKNLASVTGSAIPTTQGSITPAPSIPSTNASPVENPLRGMDTGAIAQLLQGGYRVTDRDGGGQQIIVQIDGKAIASAVQNQGLQGNNPIINRLGGGW
jgi:hypothetical protein